MNCDLDTSRHVGAKYGHKVGYGRFLQLGDAPTLSYGTFVETLEAHIIDVSTSLGWQGAGDDVGHVSRIDVVAAIHQQADYSRGIGEDGRIIVNDLHHFHGDLGQGWHSIGIVTLEVGTGSARSLSLPLLFRIKFAMPMSSYQRK